jgi:ABC-type transport system substrate-binding protein
VSLLITAGLLCSACQPVVQTVEVFQTSEVEVVRTRVVEATREVERRVEVTPPPFTTPHPILSELRVRQALAYCTNKAELIASAYPILSPEEQGRLSMASFIPKGHWAFAGDENITLYPFDPERGQALLEEAGWMPTEGSEYRANERGEELALTLTTSDSEFRKTWSAVWEEQMRACGVRIVRFHTPAAWLFGDTTGLRRRDFEVAAFAWVTGADPASPSMYACDQIPLPENQWKGQNSMGWCNPAASEGIQRANQALLRQERSEAYRTVQQELAKDIPSLPLFMRAEAYANNPALRGFDLRPGQLIYTWNIAEWEIPGKDTLVVGLNSEPAGLFDLTETAFVLDAVLALIDGVAYTSLDYDYQPRLQKQLSTLENGLASLSQVEAGEGERVMDASGEIVELRPGVVVRDANGQEIDFAGGAVPMNQVVVKYEYVDGLTWSDGTPLSQADFELYYKIACDRETGANSYLTCDRVQDVQFAENGYSVTWLPGVQDPEYFLAPFGFYPAHRALSDGRRLSDVPAREWSYLDEIKYKPMGVGPYMLTEWEPGKRLVFEANPTYYAGPPKMKRVVIELAESKNLLGGLLEGKIDFIGWDSLSLDQVEDDYQQATAEGRVRMGAVAGRTWEHIDLNLFVR